MLVVDSLWCHNKKYHNSNVSKSIPNDMNDVSKSILKYNCKFCNKHFSTTQNKWKHENYVCNKKQI